MEYSDQGDDSNSGFSRELPHYRGVDSDLDADGSSEWMGDEEPAGFTISSDIQGERGDTTVLDRQLRRIARIVDASPTAAAALSRVKWDTVENRCSPFWRPLVDVLEGALGISFQHFEVSEVVIAYSTHRGKFDHKRFLKDVFKIVQTMDSSPVPIQLSHLTLYNSFSLSPTARKTELEPALPASSLFGSLPEAGGLISSDALEAVLVKVVQALVTRGPASSDTDFGFPPVLDKEALKTELKRVWKLKLSFNDLSIFFRHLDKKGVGAIRSEFLAEELKRLKKRHSGALVRPGGNARGSPTRGRVSAATPSGRESPDGLSIQLNGSQATVADDGSIGVGSIANKPNQSQSSLPAQDLNLSRKLGPIQTRSSEMYAPLSSESISNTDAFQSLVLKVSSAFERPRHLGLPVHFQLPNDVILESQVIAAFRDQLGIHVTSGELESFQERIKIKNADRKSRNFKSSNAVVQAPAVYNGEDLKAFVVRVGLAVQKKDEYRARLLLHGKRLDVSSASVADRTVGRDAAEDGADEAIKLPSVL